MISHQNHVFLDPTDCGSGVGYHIHSEEYTNTSTKKTDYTLYGTVVISDCTRKVDWSFSNTTDDDKIEEAIRMLQEFRKKFAEAKRLIAKLNK